MLTRWPDLTCFGCKLIFAADPDHLPFHGPRVDQRFLCRSCTEKHRTREAVRRVSNHIGVQEQDATQGRLFDE